MTVARDLRYGLVGAGLMGQEHLRNVAALAGASFVAVADPHGPSRDQAVALLGPGAFVCQDYRELLARDDLDAIVIATPNHTHAAVLRDAMDTGRHILCEKPLCTTLEDARAVARAAAQYPAVFWVAMEYRYMPPVARLIDVVHSGEIGTLKMLAIREHRFPFLPKVGDWNRFNRNTGGTLVEKCCHFFDLMRLVVRSEPVRIYASGAQDVNHLDERYGGETPDILDNAFVIVDFENGVRAMLDLCMFAEGSKNQEEIAATGSMGKVEAFLPSSKVILASRERGSANEVDVPLPADVGFEGYHHGSSYIEHVRFRDAILGAGPVEVTAADGLVAVEMGLAAQRSIEAGRPVLMEEFRAGSES